MEHVAVRTVAALILAGSAAVGEDWPSWRGPDGNPVSSETNLPTKWSRDSGIAWRTALPGGGNGSPIVWKDKVFVPVELPGRRVAAVCVSVTDGKVLWTCEVPGEAPGNVHGKNSLASSSPVTDGSLVFWMFGTGVLAATDMSGHIKWKHVFGRPDLQWGLASSPVLCGKLVIQSYESNRDSRLYAFSKGNGKPAWRTEPGPAMGWSTPVVVSYRRRKMLVRNNTTICAYNPRNGRRLKSRRTKRPLLAQFRMTRWVTPTIVFDRQRMYVTAGRDGPVFALDIGTGRQVWRKERIGPYIPSPIVYKGRYYQVKDQRNSGLLTCLDAATGKVIYEGRIRDPFSASPVAGDGKIYFSNEHGLVTVIDAAGRRLNVLAENNFGEPMLASPAISNGRIYFRTRNALYAVGELSSSRTRGQMRSD